MTDLPVTLLDEAVGLGHQGYTLDRLLKIGDHKVRLRIQRDTHLRQSYAVAEVFNTELKWTAVLDTPPSTWHDKMSHITSSDPRGTGHNEARGALGSIADDLTNRMKKFLEA